MKIPLGRKSPVVSGVAATQTAKDRKVRARAIISHVEAAKARKSGTDITDLSPDDLIDDLLRHEVSV